MRWYDGAVYRIGELAERANVSKRTIDYYTSIGLLSAQRSKSNYRIYTEDSLQDLQFIEECKSLYYPLDEIRRKLDIKKEKIIDSEVEKYVKSVTQQMKQLHNDLFDLLPLLEKLDDGQREKLTNHLSLLRTTLLKSLLNVTN
ncbi:MerR family transcriptional regulator [Bacillus sp. UNC438CL73TsuS30]|uniref:MerR family transcriptional regulator n=1 Tax=Bacillus sp. UNC438CL73TsuS30 TaxID=1340434 RepID=UPI00069243AD|nr:MerR family transcriptional regulator [Bacillus sp. UNC438CL73TsuS30]